MQQFLKSAGRVAGAGIIAAELLLKFLAAMNDSRAALDARLLREPPSSITDDLESSRPRGVRV
jgi:hypothetical protein